MSPEAQKIAIAESLGWKWMRRSNSIYNDIWLFAPNEQPRVEPGPNKCPWLGFIVGVFEPCARPDKLTASQMERIFGSRCPDYLNDRNAICQAMTTLSQSEQELFGELILKITGAHELEDREDGPTREEIFAIANASAAQLSEAFLRAKNLWDDTK